MKTMVTERIHWIAASDQLPDAGMQVLVCFERNGCEERDVAIADYDDSREDGCHWEVDGSLTHFGLVMYWAEIPAGPARNHIREKRHARV